MKNAFVAFAFAIALMGCAMEEHEHEHSHEHEHIHMHPLREHEHPLGEHAHPLGEHAHPLLEHEHPSVETDFIDDGWVRLETGIVPEGYQPISIRKDRSVVVSHVFNGSLQRLILTSPNGHYCVRRHFVNDAGEFIGWADELDCWTVEELAEHYELRLP